MTIYVKIGSETNGAHSSQSANLLNPPDGFIKVPTEFEATAKQYLPWVNLTIENDVITAITYNETAKTAYDIANQPSNAELREAAYKTEKVILWGDETITVDEANMLWAAYTAEGNTEKAGQLQTLIAAAKATIRATYPD